MENKIIILVFCIFGIFVLVMCLYGWEMGVWQQIMSDLGIVHYSSIGCANEIKPSGEKISYCVEYGSYKGKYFENHFIKNDKRKN